MPEAPDVVVRGVMFEVGKSLQNAEIVLRPQYPGWADLCKKIFELLDGVLGAQAE